MSTPLGKRVEPSQGGYAVVPLGALKAEGADVTSLLHRVLTADIRQLERGQTVLGALLTPKSHIVCPVEVVRQDEGALLVCPASQLESLQAALEKLVIVDDVALSPAFRGGLKLLGSALSPSELGFDPPAIGQAVTACIGEDAVMALGDDTYGAPGVLLLADPECHPRLVGCFERQGWRQLSEGALELLRIQAGVPAFPGELSMDVLLLEAGQLGRVSLQKGCYIGQEPVCRVHNRGRVNRRLVGLMVEGGVTPASGTRLKHADKEDAGWISSAVMSPHHQAILALAFVHRRAMEGSLEVEGGGRARVVELPFVPHRLVPRSFPRYGQL